MNFRFKLRNELIYYTNFDDDRKKLCISNALKREIFELIHDRQHYEKFHKTYNRVINFVYMRYLSKHLRIYINHYLNYELNQIKRYKFYENIILINKSGISFHIIVINFIITFLIIKKDFNNVFIMIDKFSERILLILERVIYNIDK